MLFLLSQLGGDVPAPSIAASDSLPPQLVAVVHLRRENLPHTVRGEVYPVALVDGDTLRDARSFGTHPYVGEPGPIDVTSTSALDSIRSFTMYADGAAIGAFDVARIESAVYSCMAVRVGTGAMELPERFIRFGRFDPRVRPHAVSGQGFEYEYTLSYYVALSRPVVQRDFGWDPAFNPDATARLRDAIMTTARDSLLGHDGPWGAGAAWDTPRWSWEEKFRTFDLDGDGFAEGMGVIEVVVTAAGASPAPARYFATALVWVEDQGPDRLPRLLHLQRDAKAAADWDFGYHLAEVLDIDGDGTAELFYQIEDYEYYGFAILGFDGDRLIERFRGADYGC